MTTSRAIWQFHQWLSIEGTVITLNANVVRSLRKLLCYFRPALLSPWFSPSPICNHSSHSGGVRLIKNVAYFPKNRVYTV